MSVDLLVCPDYCTHYRLNQLKALEKACISRSISLKFLFNTAAITNLPSCASQFSDYQTCHPILIFNRFCILQLNLLWAIITLRPKFCIVWGEVSRIDTWIILFLFRLRLIRTKPILWTHGLTGRESSFLRFFRILYLRFSYMILLYSNAKKELLSSYLSSHKLRVIGNFVGDPTFTANLTALSIPAKATKTLSLIYVGRLSVQKSLSLVITTLKSLSNIDLQVELLIVSPDISTNRVSRFSNASIHELPAIYDERILFNLLQKSDFGICPNNIGLFTLTCLRAGLPVITHLCHQYHGPESSMLEAGRNCLPLPYPPLQDDIVQVLHLALRAKTNSTFDRSDIVSSISSEYKPEYIHYITHSLLDELFLP